MFLVLNLVIATLAATWLIAHVVWSVPVFELKNPSFTLAFWMAMSVAGAMGTYTKLKKGPHQPRQRNAGSRPSSGDSPASGTPSSPDPRG